MAFRTSLSLILLLLSPLLSTAKTILPIVGSHRYDVVITSTSLTDNDRLDPYANDGRARSIMVSSFSPVNTCRQKNIVPYMPEATASFMDEKFGIYGLPNGFFQSLNLPSCNETATRGRACNSGSFPLVLFSGALSTSRYLYSAMLQSLAATGYLVLSIDHPYDADFVEFPDGTVVTGVEIDSDAQIELSVKTRAADIVFVSEQMKNASAVEKMFAGRLHARSVPKMAVFGHSLGGAAAANAVMQVPSLRGGFNLDGSVFGPVVEAGLDRPFMLMGHENKTQETDPSWKAIWSQLKGWKKEFEVNGAAHYSFSDLPLVTSALGLEGHLPAEVGDILGTIKGIIMSQITNAYCAAFMDMVLKDGKKNGFLTAGKQFSEVKEVA
ncbi:dienelactone hydrolase [Pyrenophora tritici-repentis]|uniref:1-alkyl-2-acetylglycerophosphocholine esterase n=2 Tax=Pyrenophora tritici-repentis TaxID=45151 RepID=A0A2W1H2S8_9PLEO|nr:PAF acetylhydrolase family protein [Pyrenophora tritici-repentis Pt-1C-BFP]KAA8624574.1 PAF acetylhydrolase family protein [Pyrenophora tritici-repentis]EDU39450.1 PAF acetylhydrolase family protein [Pyrenophora tritici-repentis Pt-1C-BFP]KAF7452972.1 PAF acetylhydrolase family protein [Pyrenophora tritici-repentis]KAF7576019.1 dienelactone hydrolase [Pyrenophora tritici-repentis]KAG9377577.1 hypothetical protein A1F94_011980 [Pyrenophora tritici-repentis]